MSQGHSQAMPGFTPQAGAPPVQYVQYFPVPLGQQDNTELKDQIEALRTESQSYRGKVDNLQKEANEIKIKLGIAESKVEEYEKKKQSVVTTAARPVLNSVYYIHCMTWYLQMQPLLKALEVFPVKDQLDYVSGCLQKSLPLSATDGQHGIDEARLSRIRDKFLFGHGYHQPFTSVKELLTYVLNDCYGLDVDLD